MNNEEIMVFDTTEEINNEVNTVEPEEQSGNGIAGAFGAVVAIAVTGFIAWRYSKSNKRTERQIKKLEKKGYNITKIDEPVIEYDEDGTVKFETNENE